MNADHDLEFIESDSTPTKEDAAYSLGRLLTVAATGALASLGLYYLYQQLDEDKQGALCRKATNLLADGFQRLTHEEDD